MSSGPPRSTLPAAVAVLVAAAAIFPLATERARGQEPSVVKSVRLFAEATGRASWSPKGDRIAFDRREPNGYSQLYVADADLSNEQCLTCRMYELKKLHVGNPSWHPSGEYLAVQVETPVKPGGEPLRFMEVPGGNLGSELYLIRSDAKAFWQLTQLRERSGRVLSPRFSPEGDRLAWAERVASADGVFGRWVLRVAGLEIKRGVPRLGGIETFKPGAQRLFYDSHGFTTDQRGLVLSGNLEPDQPESGMDVYRLDTGSGALKRLTATDQELDRFALPAPNGNWIAWSSSRDVGSGAVSLERRQVTAVRASDLWLMNAEGLSVQRLTRFNDVHSPVYAGPTAVIPTSWNREGDRLLALALRVGSNEPGDLYLIEFNEPIGR